MKNKFVSVVMIFLLMLLISSCTPGNGPAAPATPTITNFTPTSGQEGDSVTITGTNFSTVPANNTVRFNGTAATITNSTATQIITTVPSGASTGKITVQTSAGTATSDDDFTVSQGLISLVSVNSSEVQGNGNSYNETGRVISDDGRYVVFYSDATNLVADDTNGLQDIFLRDLVAGTTTRVSVDSAGNQVGNYSYSARISANGRYVAMGSFAAFGTTDTNGAEDVFLRDLTLGTTTCISLIPSGTQTGNARSMYPTVSDGGLVAFQSEATDLIAGGTSGFQVFVRNLAGTTSLVSRVTGASGDQGNGDSLMPAITPDGRYVAFASFATNLTTGDSNGTIDVFVRDLTNDTTTCISLAASGTQTGNNYSDNPSITPDGRYIAFTSSATNLVSGGTTGGNYQIFVRDTSSNTTTLVSVNSSGIQANGDCQVSTISSDGRYIAFQSNATNLEEDDTNGTWDIFVRDLTAGTTTRISVDSLGVQANGGSFTPSMTSDGSALVFQSQATNLISGGTTGTQIFRRQLLP